MEKQVDKRHYDFRKYVNKRRWISIWHQVNEIIMLNPENILDIGIGSGILEMVIKRLGFCIEAVDIDPELSPDYVASVTDLPFGDSSYDVVCAFEVLEHLPYESAMRAFREMVRISRNYIVLSLPDAKTLWRYLFHIPRKGDINLFVPRPGFGPKVHKFDGEHYWEIGKRGYPLSKIINDFGQNNVKLLNTYRVAENTYHRFFVYKNTIK